MALKRRLKRLKKKIVRSVSSRNSRRNSSQECPAQLHELFLQASVYSEDVEVVVQELRNPADLQDFRKAPGPLFPNFYDSGPRYRKFLERIIEEFSLETVVETGVAHGHSTRAMLDTLARAHSSSSNKRPHLHSIDIDSRTEWDDIATNPMWTFHLTDSSRGVEEILAGIGDIDLFVHDSDHSYAHQMREYQAAWAHLKPGGFLLSDDISWSTAFLQFCKGEGLRPVILSEAPKVAGVVQKPPSP